ncbi:pentatricopeptide repeat-containing protein At1g11290, chloroplastic-like [Carica papaya]|uniref:pentatricopeptide repeat-containing protein At1g11290, chloroplastic-like n=1 Tax=Carica papaya TaxID=3649 RepID=UPI000B8CAC29|nr:pentatricopeptide repeat-containing protein At1g11290, chloroplastic-like [Carica papaya]
MSLSCPVPRLRFVKFQLPSCSFSTSTHHECFDFFARSENPPSNPIDLWSLVQFQRDGFKPYLLNKIISFCAKSVDFDVGIQLHSTVIKMGFCTNVYIHSALLNLYGKCGAISSAQKLFDGMPNRNVVTWNSLISGYLNVNSAEDAIELFGEMLRAGVAPTPFSISAALVGCSQLEAGELGEQVHGLSWKAGFGYNVVVGTALVDMYSKCCNIEDSRRVFHQIRNKNVITYTSMVSGYAQNGHAEEAMILVREMLRLGLKSNYVTYNSLLSSCSSPEDLDHCKQVQCHIIQEGLESNAYIAVSLVSVYSKCSKSLEDFQKVCSGIRCHDQISYNAVIAGFVNLGEGEETLRCFCEMRQTGIDMDFFTFTSVLGAIGMISALVEGKQVHALVVKTGDASNIFVQNGLVSVYARCGVIDDAKVVFSSITKHDVVSWNSLLSACALHGYAREAVEFMEQMRRTKVKPDGTTFLAVLTACSHGGLLEKGLEYFDLMRKDALFEPQMEHYAAIVDLLGRAGCLREAEAFVNSMKIEPGPSVYKALLSACRVHGNKDIATRNAPKLLDRWPEDPATYVLLSKLLTTEGDWDEAAGVQKLMIDRGLKKQPGYSWI